MSERENYSFLLSSLPFGVASLVMFGLSSLEGDRGSRLRKVHSLASVSNALDLSNLLPVLIAVRGKIGTASPLQTRLNSSSAVLIEDLEEFTALKQNDKGTWLPETRIIEQRKIGTPWYITDGQVKLGVESCTNALHLGRTLAISHRFREGTSTTYKKVLDRLSGYQPLGVLTTEKSLPVGAVITVVGELTKSFEGDGGMVIQKPTNTIDGEPFYITNQSFEELRQSIMQNAGIFKWLGFGFGAIGLAFLGIHFCQQIRATIRFRRTRRQIAAQNRRQEEAMRNRTGTIRPPPHPWCERQGKCIVCWENQVDAVFIPCGHICTCADCGRGLTRCPVCRRSCSVHKVFFA